MAILDPNINSYSLIIREKLIKRLMAYPALGNIKTWKRTARYQTQPDDMPIGKVYFFDDVGVADGDANAGEPRFTVAARYGISYMFRNNDELQTVELLDKLYRATMNCLLKDPTLYLPTEGAGIEAYTRFARSNHFGLVTHTQETPVAELRLELGLTYREGYEPIVVDDFLVMHTEIVFPDDIDDIPDRPRVVAEWDLPQN